MSALTYNGVAASTTGSNGGFFAKVMPEAALGWLRTLRGRHDTPVAVAGATEERRGLVILDFDGVAHPGKSGTFELLPLLERWLLDNPHVDVLISSTWRMEFGMKWLRDCFMEAELHPRVVGITPVVDPYQSHARQVEIEQWLAQHGARYRAFAVLDDEARLFTPGWPPLVLTQSNVGLQLTHLAELEKRLC